MSHRLQGELRGGAVEGPRQKLQCGELGMEVDALAGGRIVSLSIGNIEMLTPASVHAENYGSTFWDAPQVNWNWPPRAALDSEPYSVGLDNGVLTLESKVDPSGLQFVKQFRTDPTRGCFEIEYRIKNSGTNTLNVGPWEVTRVPGGLSFFPYEEVPGLPATALQPVTRSAGICWYAFDATFLNPGCKLFSGAKEGWLAHVGPERCLFVKTFQDTSPADYAPEQGEVEIWGHDGGIYIELENHGPYRALEPSASLNYRVQWYLVRVPEHITIKAENPELVSFVRTLIRGN